MIIRSNTHWIPFILGIVLMGVASILRHYVALSDGLDGLIRGIAIGLLAISLLLAVKQKDKRKEGSPPGNA